MIDDPTPAAEPSKTPPLVDKIPVDLFIKDASQNVSVQGMLADNPELRTAVLSETEWEAALTAYNKKRIV